MKTIEIIVARDGKTTVKTAGFHGSSCREASRFIQQAIGKTQSERLTRIIQEFGNLWGSWGI